MKTVHVNGAKGFYRPEPIRHAPRAGRVPPWESDIDYLADELARFVSEADVVYHLAGVNRPKDPAEFETGNAGSIRTS